MALFKPYKITSSQLNSLPIIEGQLIVTTDDGALYVDINSITRKRVAEEDVLEFEVVQSLPTGSAIHEDKIYLIETDGSSGPGGRGITYTLSRSGNTVTLTGSDESTSSFTLDTVPTKVSDLTNDSGFISGITSTDVTTALGFTPYNATNPNGYITNSVNNLTNYYKKDETYTQTEINTLIGAISSLDMRIVQTLPTTDISTSSIYLVSKSTAETQNIYDEFVYINNNWEKIGDTAIDLSDYSTTSEIQNMIDDAIGDALEASY